MGVYLFPGTSQERPCSAVSVLGLIGTKSFRILASCGIATYIDAKHAIAHNKIMIIDRECVITGSFNFTKAAEEKNAENILVIRGNPELTAKYIGNFDWHLRHSEVYQGRGG